MFIGLVVLVVGNRSGWFSSKEEKQAQQGKSTGGPSIAPVRVAVIKPEGLENTLNTTGSLIANEEVELHAEISGLVQNINFDEGQHVKKGQVLFTIRTDELRAQLQKLEYSKKLAETTQQRNKQLLDKEAISQQEYDIAFTELQTAQADIENLRAMIDKSVVRAPFDGRIGLRYISKGSYITPANRVSNLVNYDPIKLDFSIPAKYASQVTAGKKVNFSVEGSTEKMEATVYAIEPSINAETRTILLRAKRPNKDGKLYPGMFANITLILDKVESALMVPTEALVPQQGGYTVYKVKDNKAQPTEVTVGQRTPRKVEILKGVSAGDTVIYSGLQMLRPGINLSIKGVFEDVQNGSDAGLAQQ